MRALIIAAFAVLATSPALAENRCQSEYLSGDDLAIMASVRPAETPASATRMARIERVALLHGLTDYMGRVGAEDLSQIRSVQPAGAMVMSCPVN